MTTSDYLEQLQQDKQDLVDNLTTKGISGLTGDETFTELVPEVLNIPSGEDISNYMGSEFNYSNNGYASVYIGNWYKGIKKLKGIYVGNGNWNGLFRNFKGTHIDLNDVDFRNTTTFSGLFNDCTELLNIDFGNNINNKNTTQLSDCSYMFNNCSKIETINMNGFNTSNVTSFFYMFYGCSKLTTLDISSFDFSRVTNVYQGGGTNVRDMFYGCSNLENLTFGINLGKGFTTTDDYGINFSQSSKLTHDSLMDIINKLYDLNLTYDVAGGGTLYRKKIAIGSTNLAKLTSAEIQIATDKGWDVVATI